MAPKVRPKEAGISFSVFRGISAMAISIETSGRLNPGLSGKGGDVVGQSGNSLISPLSGLALLEVFPPASR